VRLRVTATPASSGTVGGHWMINCSVLIHVDYSCGPLCSPLTSNASNYYSGHAAQQLQLSMIELVLIVCFTSCVVVVVVILIAVFCRRIRAHKPKCRCAWGTCCSSSSGSDCCCSCCKIMLCDRPMLYNHSKSRCVKIWLLAQFVVAHCNYEVAQQKVRSHPSHFPIFFP